MAMGAVQPIGASGITPSYATPASSETVRPRKGMYIEVVNGSGGSINVTRVDAGKTGAGSSATNPVTAVAAGARAKIPVLKAMASASTGLCTVQFSATSSITAGWFTIGAN